VKRLKRTRIVVQTSAVALVTAALVFAGISLISGSKSGALPITSSSCSGTSFCITSPSPGPALNPLASPVPNLPLTFSNPLSAPIRVYSLTVSFTNAFPSGCPSSELTLNGVAVSLPSAIATPGVTFSFTGSQFAVPKAVGSTPGTAVDTLTLALPDNHQNQDACRGLALALQYSALAYYTNATSSVLSSSPSPSNAGQAITLTDTVSSASDTHTPVGSVLFYACTSAAASSCAAAPLGAAVALNGSGVATSTTTPSTGGTYYYEAIFTPTDATNFTASTSNVLTQSVSAGASSKVYLWVADDETDIGHPVTYVGQVLGHDSHVDASAGGTMTFRDNGVVITSCANAAVSHGFAYCGVTYLSTLGSPHTITATYNGDAHHSAGTSNTISEQVYRVRANNHVTGSSPTILGGTLTFTATVTGAGVAPTGTVTWNLSTPSGVSACPSTATLVNGVATCTITASKAGNYSASDSYGGDANYTSVGSNTASVGVKATPNDILKPSLNPTSVAVPVTFTATVSGSAGVAPTGSVTFEVGGNALYMCGTKGVVNLVNGVATCTLSSPTTVGSPFQLTAPYSGDTNYAAANSSTVSEVVLKATPTNKVTNSSETTVGSKLTFTAKVTGPGYTPTGSITWSVSTPSGVTSCATHATLNNGVTTCVITASKAGTYSASDSYAGDVNYSSLPSNLDSVLINGGKTPHLSLVGGNQP
jgi:Bacterial Ig-like domain (group 3)